MPPAIPDRWLEYTTCGKIIEGTKIICFKVPLRKHVQVGNKDIPEVWDVTALLETVPNLGIVIDLSNTGRYYDPREVMNGGVYYKKIAMPGRVIPPAAHVDEFMNTVDEFAKKGKLVGVHCTHGLNRTGYMVCRYMRDRLGMKGDEAIKRFEEARGFKIERQNYIDDILGKPPCPSDPVDTVIVRPLPSNSSNNNETSSRCRKDSDSLMDVNRPYDFRYDY